MAMASTTTRRLLSLPRITTLFSSLLVALGSGTNYVFSAYAPQLGSRLHITHTGLNIIGLAGNMGGSSTGPFLGRIVDSRGPRCLLIGAFVFLFVGYSGTRYIYNNGVPSSEFISPINFWLLVACAFMTGAGGHGGISSAINATAKSFPDRARATTTGIVLSGYGLAAFLFSLFLPFFPNDTSSFLLLLALGTSFPMIIGFFFVRPIPLPAHEIIGSADYDIIDNPYVGGVDASTIFQHNDESRVLLLSNMTEIQPVSSSSPHTHDESSLLSNPSELSSSHSSSPEDSPHHFGNNKPYFASRSAMHENLPNIHGKQLWWSSDFWVAFAILSLLSGTGIMYINNVGAIAQALFAKDNLNYDEAIASHWQATQVSAISITNFIGRILIGLISDFAKNRLHFPRSYCISLVAFLFVVSQLIAVATDDVKDLWKASLALGLAYGGLFGLFPTIIIEWFGIAHFSENWGFLLLSPMLGGNILSVAFGRNLDAHSTSTPITPFNSTSNPVSPVMLRAELPSEPRCSIGRDCYVASLYITTTACFLSLLLSVWAGWMDRRRSAAGGLRSKDITEVIWEEDEDH